MGVFDPVPTSTLEARIAALEAQNLVFAAQLAQQQQGNAAAIAAVAALRQSGDAQAADALQAEIDARQLVLENIATQLGNEIQARVLGDRLARGGGPSMIALVSGSLPGPDFVADGFGRSILVPFVEVN